jgi:hypothetical protein
MHKSPSLPGSLSSLCTYAPQHHPLPLVPPCQVAPPCTYYLRPQCLLSAQLEVNLRLGAVAFPPPHPSPISILPLVPTPGSPFPPSPLLCSVPGAQVPWVLQSRLRLAQMLKAELQPPPPLGYLSLCPLPLLSPPGVKPAAGLCAHLTV